MKLKVIAIAAACAMAFCAVPFASVQADNTAVLVASAASAQEFNIPVTLQHHDNPENKSMGNGALVQMGKIVVDASGNATLQLAFRSMTYLGQKGYLGFLNKVTSNGTIPATVIDTYTDFYDSFNNEDADTYQNELKSRLKDGWYPKTVSIPLDSSDVKYDANGKIIGVNTNRIEVQVYVPVMESINAGGGYQYAYLDVRDCLFTGSSATLDGSVTMNNYINVSDAYIGSDATVQISTGDGRSDTITLSDLTAGNEANQYYVSTKLPAKDMNTALTGVITSSDGSELETFTTNFATYATALSKSADATEEQRVLAAELLNYGSRAQVYFNYNYTGENTELANNGLASKRKDTYTSVTSDNLASYTYETSGTLNGLTYGGSSLSLLSDVGIKHYFKLDSGKINDHSFVVNGTAQTPQYDETSGMYYVTVSGISAQNLDADYIVKVDNSYTLTYCALDYCNTAINQTSKKYNSLKKVAQALYKYWEAAENVSN